jgi:peroxiredoxin Q/BCP
VDSNRNWSEKLHLPYLLLSDPEGLAGEALGVTRRIMLGAWKVEFFRRSTYLVDIHGVVAAVWREVKVRGHATEVLETSKSVARPGD